MRHDSITRKKPKFLVARVALISSADSAALSAFAEELALAPGVMVCTTTFPDTVAVITTVDEALWYGNDVLVVVSA